jgi:hypothetical protein
MKRKYDIIGIKKQAQQSLEFETRVDNVIFDIDENKTFSGNATIVWSVDMEVRGWGIKDLNISISKVEVNGVVSDVATDTETDFDETYVNGVDDWTMDSYVRTREMEGSLVPDSLEVDYGRKNIDVNF